MSINRLTVIFLALALALGISGLTATVRAQDELPDEYVLPGEEVFPEGIAYQEDSGDFFVGSTTDGTVFQGNIEERETEVFLEGGKDGRTTAIGMKLDDWGRLFISGGPTGQMFVYDAKSGELIAKFDNGLGEEETFVNDVTLTPNGDAYFTDSATPNLYRVFTNEADELEFEQFINFEGTPLMYEEGFNLNGIAATGDGQYLITVQSNTGELFRIDTADKEVIEIDLGGETLTNGDGLVLDGQTLYVVRNQQALIVPVELSSDYSSGTVGKTFTDASFKTPTTAAKAGDRLLVVNSQFAARESGNPDLPFTVSAVEIPSAKIPDGMGNTGGGGLATGASFAWGNLLLLASLLATGSYAVLRRR